MNLPIDLIPNTNPPRFRWSQVVSGRVVDHAGELPPSVEGAVIALIRLVRLRDAEIEGLKKRNTGLVEVVAAQQKKLDKQTEGETVDTGTGQVPTSVKVPQQSPVKKGKGAG